MKFCEIFFFAFFSWTGADATNVPPERCGVVEQNLPVLPRGQLNRPGHNTTSSVLVFLQFKLQTRTEITAGFCAHCRCVVGPHPLQVSDLFHAPPPLGIVLSSLSFIHQWKWRNFVTDSLKSIADSVMHISESLIIKKWERKNC
jgi:hypothetical protein